MAQPRPPQNANEEELVVIGCCCRLFFFRVSVEFKKKADEQVRLCSIFEYCSLLVCKDLAELRRTGGGSQLPLSLLIVVGAEHAVPPNDDAVLVHLVVDRDVQVHAVSASARLACYRQHFASRRRERGFLFRSGAVVVVFFEIANHTWHAVGRVRGQVRGL